MRPTQPGAPLSASVLPSVDFQSDRGPVSGGSLAVLSGAASARRRREKAIDEAVPRTEAETGWVDVGDLNDIEEGRAIIGVLPQGERVAVFRFQNRLGPPNLCSHQNGPIGEGKVVLGFATCPWHGYQYRLEDGCAPPPFKERCANIASNSSDHVCWSILSPFRSGRGSSRSRLPMFWPLNLHQRR